MPDRDGGPGVNAGSGKAPAEAEPRLEHRPRDPHGGPDGQDLSSGSRDTDERKSVTPLAGLADVLRAVYGSKRRPRKDLVVSALREQPSLAPSDLPELEAMSASDRTLQRTRELMLLALEWSEDGLQLGPLLDFVGATLARHPVFSDDALAGVLDNLPSAPSEEVALRHLSSRSFEDLSWPAPNPQFGKKEAGQCRENSLCCVLLWFVTTRGMPVRRVRRHLQEHLWGPFSDRCDSDSKRLRSLMAARDAGAMAVLAEELEGQLDEEAQRVEAALQARDQAMERARESETAAGAVSEELEAAKTKIQELSGELEATLASKETQGEHLRDDYENLRARMLRRLKSEIALLSEGLQALRRTPPKTHVMDDHAERAIEGLTQEIETLRGGK